MIDITQLKKTLIKISRETAIKLILYPALHYKIAVEDEDIQIKSRNERIRAGKVAVTHILGEIEANHPFPWKILRFPQDRFILLLRKDSFF